MNQTNNDQKETEKTKLGDKRAPVRRSLLVPRGLSEGGLKIGGSSILDKVMSVEHAKASIEFKPYETLTSALQSLSAKEKDILVQRFNLEGKGKKTLEDIGSQLNVTRERIRQIERAAIKKLALLTLATDDNGLSVMARVVRKTIEDYGGAAAEDFVIEYLINRASPHPLHKQALHFFLNRVLTNQLEKIKADKFWRFGWRLRDASLTGPQTIINQAISLAQELKQPMGEDDFIKRLRAKIEKAEIVVTDDEIIAALNLSVVLKPNRFGAWGLAKWPTITPKRMMDKVYLILEREKRPLHFTEITKLINEANFDDKVAHDATIHNELILDDRFVLVGKGLYVLGEWGYQAGTVKDVIIRILQASQQPLTKEEIIVRVLKQRIVAASTINLALMNKDLFQKDQTGTYSLRESGAPINSMPSSAANAGTAQPTSPKTATAQAGD